MHDNGKVASSTQSSPEFKVVGPPTRHDAYMITLNLDSMLYIPVQ